MKGGKQHVVEKCFGEVFRYTRTKMDRKVQGFEMHMLRMRICKAREQVDCFCGIARRALKSHDISRVCGADGVVASCTHSKNGVHHHCVKTSQSTHQHTHNAQRTTSNPRHTAQNKTHTMQQSTHHKTHRNNARIWMTMKRIF